MLSLCSLPGASAKELTFGMSAAFSGPTRGLGVEYYRGIMAYFAMVNAQGGVKGNTFAIKAYDDGYNPGPCVENTIRLVEQDDVFALLNYVGTPTTTRMLPLLKKFEDRHIYLLFPFTGAEPLRNQPYGRFVYNLRTSYFDETRGLVDHLVGVGRKRVAVFYQADAYGRNGWDGVRRALAENGLEMVGEAAYKRGSSWTDDYSEAVGIIQAAKPDAVIMIGSYAASAGFVRDARNLGLDVPLASISFSDADNILRLLSAEQARTGNDYTCCLLFSQVVPSYEDVTLSGVRLYRQAMEAGPPMPPAELMNETYEPRKYGVVSFEGFLNGMVLVEMVRRMGDNPERNRIPEIMSSMRDFSLGLDERVDFLPGSNQGMHSVYYTIILNDRLVPLRDWQRWRK
ncbi:MAG: ABC transporter substrate-binding protein [Proteobacteria bacterium]|nr:ABC transporter substrate-binding protein [Pseudomonadota bacterium]MBU1612257.1 ABC transporter substrate-binding protein [Pseudomonadota bacterium]